MARTQIGTNLVGDEGIVRADLNVSTAGDAVIRKIIAGANVTISFTGADAGTGDVTINAAGGGGGGSANIGQATVDFGANEDTATVTVSGQAWVTLASTILCTPSGEVTADHDPEDYIIEGLTAIAINKVAGTGFDILCHAPEGTHGQYIINFTGV